MQIWPECPACAGHHEAIHKYGVHVVAAYDRDGALDALPYLSAHEAHALAFWLEGGDRLIDALRAQGR